MEGIIVQVEKLILGPRYVLHCMYRTIHSVRSVGHADCRLVQQLKVSDEIDWSYLDIVELLGCFGKVFVCVYFRRDDGSVSRRPRKQIRSS